MPAVKYTPFTAEQIQRRGHRFKDVSDRRFGHLYVIRPIGTTKNRTIVWECLCDCGNLTTVSSGNLQSAQVASCGCRKGGHTRFARKHGLARSREGVKTLHAWKHALDRCTDPSNWAYKYYGGRGIRMCQGWATSVVQFSRDLGMPPSPLHSVDRINNESGHYSCGKCAECVANGWPKNVRWATKSEQMRNYRLNRLITARGVTRTLIEWQEICGLDGRTIHSRLKRGWTAEDAIFMPRGWHSYKKRIRQGESHSWPAKSFLR